MTTHPTPKGTDMPKTYQWTRESSLAETTETFDALAAVDDLSTLQDVEAVIEVGGLRGTFSSFGRFEGGALAVSDGSWLVRRFDGLPGDYLASLRFTVPDPKPAPPVGIELAKTLSECVDEDCPAHNLPDDWREHVAIVPRLTREGLLALDAEPEGYRVVWFDGDVDPWGWRSREETGSYVNSYGFHDGYLIPKGDPTTKH